MKQVYYMIIYEILPAICMQIKGLVTTGTDNY